MARSSSTSEGSTVFGLLWLAFWVILNGWLWPYIGNSWLEYAGKAPQIAWWQGALIGFVPYLSRFVIPIAVVTWFLLLVLK